MEKRDNIIIRKAKETDSFGLTTVHIKSWRKTYDGIIPKEYLDNLSFEHREAKWREVLSANDRIHLVYVAVNGNKEIVGFAKGGSERDGNPDYKGELYGIYILNEYQRRSIGRQLMSRVAGNLSKLGFNSMLVWVLAGNQGAMGFYESLGGRKIDERYISLGEARLLEYAYGWENTREMIRMGK